MKKLLLAGAAALTLAACATSTPYAPAERSGGYGFSDQQIEENRFRITFRGNSSTERETVENFLLYRAAELTVSNGYDYFLVTEGDVERRTTVTGSTLGGPAFFGRYGFGPYGFGFPYYAYGWGWGAPYGNTVAREITRYSAIAFIVMESGEKPRDNPQAFDARSVLENLRPVVLQSGG
ncbi:MAG: hypothetical protein AAGC56_07360 [Pseudomonadota bacterium]